MSAGQRRVPLLSAAIALASASQPIDISAYPHNTIYLTGTGTTSSGVVTVEEADWDPQTAVPYGGTWSAITTLNASAVTGGQQLAYHLPAPSAYAFLRVRISTVIGGGGSVTVALRSRY
jgi:hypothetical protein